MQSNIQTIYIAIYGWVYEINFFLNFVSSNNVTKKKLTQQVCDKIKHGTSHVHSYLLAFKLK